MSFIGLVFRLAVLTALALGACKDSGPKDSAPDDTEPIETGADDMIWPSGDRILVYTGNGGVAGDTTGWGQVTGLDAHIKEKYGWNTDIRDSLGDDLSDFRMIAFMAPGAWGEDSFTQDQFDLLLGAMANGTRMVVMQEVTDCAAGTTNSLLEGLGSAMRFSGESAQEYMMQESSYVGGGQPVDGVKSLAFSDPCYIQLNGGQYLSHVEGNTVVGRERVGPGGDIVAIGDFEFLDDTGNSKYADNVLFADRLAEVVPGYVAEKKGK